MRINLLTKTLKKMNFSLTKWRMRGLLLNKIDDGFGDKIKFIMEEIVIIIVEGVLVIMMMTE